MCWHYLAVFAELIATPFQQLSLVWGIVPLYFALFFSEVTSAKKSFRTAIQTGFSFLWAATQWIFWHRTAVMTPGTTAGSTLVHLVVTGIVLVLGALALYSGLRRRFPRYTSFLGHTRFSNYFMIAIYPMQAHVLVWTWERLLVVIGLAVPIWLVLHFGLMPLRGKK